MTKETKIKDSFDKIFNALHSWKNNCPPDNDEVMQALESNCKIHQENAEILSALENVLLAHDYDGAMTQGNAVLSPAIRHMVRKTIDKVKK